MYDVIIIGAGIIGSSVARFLSKYKGNFLVIDKEDDVACGTTKANSGIVHAGFDAKVGSKKAYYNVRGAKMYPELAKELEFPFEINGAFVLSFTEDGLEGLKELEEKAKLNGVDGVEILTGDEIRKLEPNVSKEVKYGLYAKTSGIVSPYEMCIAMAENASSNGVDFKFNQRVVDIKKLNDHFVIKTNDNEFETKVIVNAAGLFSDEINNMLSNEKYHIVPRKGEYVLLDREFESITSKTLFQLPTKMGKGILVTKTTHGNILVGPTAKDQDDKDDVATSYLGLKDAWEKGNLSVNNLPRGGIITQFSGLRAHEDKNDFTVEWSKDVEGLFNLIGIESPGLASSPAIATDTVDAVAKYLKLDLNKDYNPHRKAIRRVSHMTDKELEEALKENEEYGHIICRCEVVSEAEIREAIRRKPGARDLDGVKRRTRAGMGRCQMGFCTPKIMNILAEELGIKIDDVTKSGDNSKIIVGKIKQ